MAIFTLDTDTNTFVRKAMADGGGTLFPNASTAPTTGYMVGRSDLIPSITLEDVTHTSNLLLMAVEGARELARVANEYAGVANLSVGIWQDENGVTWVDLSEHVDSLEDATSLGKLLGELAIYDISAGESINL